MKPFAIGPLFSSAAKALVALLLIVGLFIGAYFFGEYVSLKIALVGFLGVLLIVAIRDLTQKKHTILRNFPVIGHFRYWIEGIGPELRQYLFASDKEEGPFNRLERSTIYAMSKKENSNTSFGTTQNLEAGRHLIIEHSPFPINAPRESEPGYNPLHNLPCAKVMGGWRDRPKKFRPDSAICISAMSFGSIGGVALEALNEGAKIANCLHNAGEGGLSPHHKKGGKIIFQIGTGYFGCCDEPGVFSLEKLVQLVEENPEIKAIEIKLSQGAKGGKGGLLPGHKVTEAIAEARGIPVGKSCYSPPGHSAFKTVSEMIDFIEKIAEATGLPVGIKAAVGKVKFWEKLAKKMKETGRGPDFIAIDGGEGGTGAAPLFFSDHVGYPFKDAFSMVYRTFAEQEMHNNVLWIGSGKLGLVENAAFAFAMGCDMIAIGRESLFSIGCIQARLCHTNRCPAGIATHNKWLQRGLDPALKSVRFANYLEELRQSMLSISHACGVEHPSLIRPEDIVFRDEDLGPRKAYEFYGYERGWGLPGEQDMRDIRAIMQGAPQESPALTEVGS